MTREEAIKLIELAKAEIEWEYSLEYQVAFDAAIKALEQEPVLDKIRAKIETEKIGYPPSADYYKAVTDALQIIDKYRQEG